MLKKQIAILGGGFDPITVGHVQLANFVLKRLYFDEVWIMPCFEHKYGKEMVLSNHRLKMCKLAVKGHKNIKVSNFEIKNKFSGATFDLVNKLLKSSLSKRYFFSIIIGQDNADSFDKWYKYVELEKLTRFIVVTRKGIKRNKKVNWYLKYPHLYLDAEKEIIKSSSTKVRTLLKEKKFGLVKKLIDEDVLKYILDNNLYI